jgi:hypothetical protein
MIDTVDIIQEQKMRGRVVQPTEDATLVVADRLFELVVGL